LPWAVQVGCCLQYLIANTHLHETTAIPGALLQSLKGLKLARILLLFRTVFKVAGPRRTHDLVLVDSEKERCYLSSTHAPSLEKDRGFC
jgi:hypothetical protein